MPSFAQVVEALKPSYRSIDLRIAMRRQPVSTATRTETHTTWTHEEVWTADLLIVRLGSERVEDIIRRHDDLRFAVPIQTDTLKILLDALPISEWGTISNAIEHGGPSVIHDTKVVLPPVSLEH